MITLLSRRAFRAATALLAGVRGSVPAPAAGDQDKLLHGDGTWRTVSNASAATNAEAAAGTDTSKFLTPAARRYAEAFARNALAPRGGVFLDGTTSNRVVSTLTGQSIATDPFSIHLVERVNSSAPAVSNETYAYLGSSATLAGAADGYMILRGETGGQLRLLIFGATGSDYNRWSLSSFYTTYGGKSVTIAVVRNSSGNPTIYINGVDVTASGSFDSGGSAPTWQGTITSTYFGFGASGASSVAGRWSAASLYNLALSASEVLEIYELGGAVPARFQFGSQVATYTSDFSAGADSWSNSLGSNVVTGNIDSIGGQDDNLRAQTSAGGVSIGLQRTFGTSNGKRVRISGSVYRPSANGTVIARLYVRQSTGGTSANSTDYHAFSASDTWEPFEIDLDMTAGNTILALRSADGSGSIDAVVSNGDILYFRNITRKILGAVVHLPLNDGIGYQLHDESTNKLDAVMTTTGVSHLIPQRRGFVRGTLTWAATHEGKSLLGQRALPPGACIEKVFVKPTVGSSGTGLQVGSVSSAGRWVASDTYGTARKVYASPLNQGQADTTSDNDSTVMVDPDSANYTGSLDCEVIYDVSSQAVA